MNCAEEIIRANNLLQFIHQVTIEIRFRKSLAQERFKSNLEFRNQIIVSSIKFRKGFAKSLVFQQDRISHSEKRVISIKPLKQKLSLRNHYRRCYSCVCK